MVASLSRAGEQAGRFTGAGQTAGYGADDRLETARLLLRMFTPADLDGLHAIASDAEAMRFIGDGHPLSRAETGRNLAAIISAFQRRGFGRWALTLKESGALVGYCGFGLGSEEIGIELAYLLAKSEWGKGLATEAGAACLRYGFEQLGLDSIAALTRPENLKSRRVMERLKMRFVSDGSYHGYSCVRYSISRADWRPDGSHYRLIRPS
ncbi:MAG: GNAT family N-acetyltransferase [Acidobacteriota bacterium]|nr:GNAT family N-acetyltransferase [Acidobacteriota bacterium]